MPVSSCHFQYLCYKLVFSNLVILKWYVFVVLICVSLIMSEVYIFPCLLAISSFFCLLIFFPYFEGAGRDY